MIFTANGKVNADSGRRPIISIYVTLVTTKQRQA